MFMGKQAAMLFRAFAGFHAILFLTARPEEEKFRI